jgi:hypothetical protein
MKLTSIYSLFVIVLILGSCSNNVVNSEKSVCPLQAPYEYFDQLSKEEFYFEDLLHKLNTAKGKNSTEEINTFTKEFETTQANCIQKMETKFPEGSIKIPFEQLHGKDTLTVISAYVSGFSFPWNTATSICFYFTLEYEIHQKDLWFIPISLKFIDAEEDIIYMCHLPANSNGKSRFLVKAQFTFRNFTKLIINQ